MEIILEQPVVRHNCYIEIQDDPRARELGEGSQVRCSCGRKFERYRDWRGELTWRMMVSR